MWFDGCFDLMHYGHANALRQAKELCDILVVGVHSDAEIKKHKGSPVIPEHIRYEQVKGCKWVDEVVTGAPYITSIETLDKHRCSHGIHGDDISTDENGVDSFDEIKKAGRFKVIKRTRGVSTTDLVGRMMLHTRTPQIDDGLDWLTQVRENNFQPSTHQIVQFTSKDQRHPLKDDKIVYIDGAWDVFHYGHMRALAKAKSLGTYLLVGVYSDKTVSMYKGEGYPIMSMYERILLLLSCKYVDEVIMDVPYIVNQTFLDERKISVVAHGMDDTPHELGAELKYNVPRSLGIYQSFDSGCEITTTWIVHRIMDNWRSFEERQRRKVDKEKQQQLWLAQQAELAEE